LTAVVVKSGYMLETPVRLIVHPENQDRENLSDRDNQQERLEKEPNETRNRLLLGRIR